MEMGRGQGTRGGRRARLVDGFFLFFFFFITLKPRVE
jgi:hypothetical protein